ncbi:MAG: hypothetical protein MRY63_11410 [Neomegalonema sp.]|nr:hypothetical protein [Neomegalonema sp.]
MGKFSTGKLSSAGRLPAASRKNRLLGSAALLFASAWQFPAHATVFELGDGIVIEGEIQEAGRDVLTVQTSEGMRLLPTARVQRMTVDLSDGSSITGRLVYWFDGLYEMQTDRGSVRIYNGEIIADLRSAAAQVMAVPQSEPEAQPEPEPEPTRAPTPEPEPEPREQIAARVDAPAQESAPDADPKRSSRRAAAQAALIRRQEEERRRAANGEPVAQQRETLAQAEQAREPEPEPEVEVEEEPLTEEELRARIASMFTSPQLVDRGEDRFSVQAASPQGIEEGRAGADGLEEADDTLRSLEENFASVRDDLTTPRADVPDVTAGIDTSSVESKLDLGDATRQASTPTGPGRVANASPNTIDALADRDEAIAPGAAPGALEKVQVSDLNSAPFSSEESLASDAEIAAANVSQIDAVDPTPTPARDIQLSDVREGLGEDTGIATLADAQPQLPAAATSAMSGANGDQLATTDQVADLSALPDARPATPQMNEASRAQGPEDERDQVIPEGLQANRAPNLPGVANAAPQVPDMEGPLRRLALATPEMDLRSDDASGGATLEPRGAFAAPLSPGGMIASAQPPAPKAPGFGSSGGLNFGTIEVPGQSSGQQTQPAAAERANEPRETPVPQRQAQPQASPSPSGNSQSQNDAPSGLGGVLSTLFFGDEAEQNEGASSSPSTRPRRAQPETSVQSGTAGQAPLQEAPSAPRAVLPQAKRDQTARSSASDIAPSSAQQAVEVLSKTAPDTLENAAIDKAPAQTQTSASAPDAAIADLGTPAAREEDAAQISEKQDEIELALDTANQAPVVPDVVPSPALDTQKGDGADEAAPALSDPQQAAEPTAREAQTPQDQEPVKKPIVDRKAASEQPHRGEPDPAPLDPATPAGNDRSSPRPQPIERAMLEDFALGVAGNARYAPATSCARIATREAVPGATGDPMVLSYSDDMPSSLVHNLVETYLREADLPMHIAHRKGDETLLKAQRASLSRPGAVAARAERSAAAVEDKLQAGQSDLGLFPGALDATGLGQPVALDAIAAVAHAGNPVAALTARQINGLLRGRIIDWSMIDPSRTGRPRLYLPPEGSATLTMVKAFSRVRRTDAGAVTHIADPIERAAAAANDPNGIAFVSVAALSDKARILPIGERRGDTLPSEKAVLSGAYPLVRMIYARTGSDENHALTPSLQQFLFGPRGQSVLRKMGLVPITDCLTGDCAVTLAAPQALSEAIDAAQTAHPVRVEKSDQVPGALMETLNFDDGEKPVEAALSRFILDYAPNADAQKPPRASVIAYGSSREAGERRAAIRAEAVSLALRCAGIPVTRTLVNTPSRLSLSSMLGVEEKVEIRLSK